MEVKDKYILLRIFIDSTDIFKYRTLYEMIVYRAKKQGLAGATVIEGIQGFGKGSILHSYKFMELSDKEPVAIEIIDEEDKIMVFYEVLNSFFEKMLYGCLITLEKVDVLLYKKGEKDISHSHSPDSDK